jgi:hypothetical protein
MAILGSEDYDVTQIKIDSISVANMLFPVKNPQAEKDENGDGLIDLMIHVSRRDLIQALGLDQMAAGTVVPITVEGILLDGTRFIATDCVTLVGRED